MTTPKPRKVEVLADCLLSVKKGSIVLVDERQYETARRILKPVEVKIKKKTKEIEMAESNAEIETR